ncbi:cytochrome P450 [Streptomyces aculeolatus]
MTDHLSWYDEIREAGRVHWDEETRSWYVTRFDDVWELLVDDRLGARSAKAHSERMTPAQRELCAPVLDSVSKWPVFTDAPRHTTLHRLILPCFAPAETERVTGVARSCLKSAEPADWGSDDVVEAVIQPACVAALAAFLGISPADVTRVTEWSARLITFAGQTAYDHEVVTRASVALREFGDFVMRTCAAGNSVLSSSMRRSLREGVLDRSEVVAVYGQLVTGFLQPTISALAMAIETLAGDGAMKAAFEDAPDTFISESIRLASPFHFAPRRTLRDMQFAGRLIPAGQRVVLLLVAANRDPRRFPDPLRFRMDRGTPPHVSFARGRYACLGAGLTRHLMRAVLTALAEQPAGLAPPATVEWHVGRGMRMPLRLTRTKA